MKNASVVHAAIQAPLSGAYVVVNRIVQAATSGNPSGKSDERLQQEVRESTAAFESRVAAGPQMPLPVSLHEHAVVAQEQYDEIHAAMKADHPVVAALASPVTATIAAISKGIIGVTSDKNPTGKSDAQLRAEVKKSMNFAP